MTLGHGRAWPFSATTTCRNKGGVASKGVVTIVEVKLECLCSDLVAGINQVINEELALMVTYNQSNLLNWIGIGTQSMTMLLLTLDPEQNVLGYMLRCHWVKTSPQNCLPKHPSSLLVEVILAC